MPACHALPPAPAYHASRHAPFFFPPVRHDTSGPIITSPSHPQVGPQSRGAWSEIILPVPKFSDDKPSFLEIKDSSARSRRCCLHKHKTLPPRARSPPRPFGRPHVTPASPPTPQTCTCVRACEHSEPRPPALCAPANRACFVGASQVNARRDFGAVQRSLALWLPTLRAAHAGPACFLPCARCAKRGASVCENELSLLGARMTDLAM